MSGEPKTCIKFERIRKQKVDIIPLIASIKKETTVLLGLIFENKVLNYCY